MDKENTPQEKEAKKPHDAFFRWLFANVTHFRYLLELSGKVNADVGEFLTAVNLDTLVRIPDSYSEVEETGDADLAFRVNVSTGAPVFVGILVEHKSGRDSDVFNQVARYVRSVMKRFDKGRLFDGLPTMAIIFYNGRENWNPLEILEKGYPEYFHGSVLPFHCAFVNMADIPDSDCLACEDVVAGMGIACMAHAYDKDKLLEILPKFKPLLKKLPDGEASCLLSKISIYLAEHLGDKIQEELDMAFKSIGQKYGFVSAGDVYRQRIADARLEEQAKAQKQIAEERQKAEAERQKAENAEAKLAQNLADTEAVLRGMGISEKQIEEMQAKLEALRQSRLSKIEPSK